METVFWVALCALAYAFVGYPAVLKALVAALGKTQEEGKGHFPSVTMILSVFNEEEVIEAKIRNWQALEYPGRLALIIVSDGSTDKTESIAKAWENDRIRLLVQERNQGKTAALNRAAVEAEGDILLFTDANSMLDSDAVTRLATHFRSPDVGLVSGHTEYQSADGGNGGGAYRRYEDWLKSLESSLWGIVGADGAIYAMRRSLYRPLRLEHINDFLHPIQTVMSGCRAVQEQTAVCREPLETVGAGELKRQTRIMTQSWMIVFSQVGELVRKRCFGFLWQLASHKVLRWLTVPLLAVLLAATFCVAERCGVYQLALWAQILFYLTAYLFRRADGGIKQLPYNFLLLHWAAVIGFVHWARGEKYVSWKPRNK